MTDRDPSGFDLKTDSAQDEPGMVTLLIVSSVGVAVASGAAEFLTVTGLYIPHGLTMLAGILIGLPIGSEARRIIRKSKCD